MWSCQQPPELAAVPDNQILAFLIRFSSGFEEPSFNLTHDPTILILSIHVFSRISIEDCR